MTDNQILVWAEEYLATDGKTKTINSKKILQTSYSTVYKIQTEHRDFYLKRIPDDLFSEPDVINFLNTTNCRHVPKFVAKNESLNCFLMTSCGDESLRHLFKGKLEISQMKIGINNFTQIQRSLEDKIPEMLSIQIPDWRLKKFPLLYSQLIQQDTLLLSDGMTEQEINQLQDLQDVCSSLCNELLNFAIPETINHNDFQENNMILDKATGNISIIDWGEAVITHPFFSLCGCLWNITYFYKMQTDDPQYKALQLLCIEPWLEFYSEEQLIKILNLTTKLSGVYAALGYEKMYKATQNQEDTVQREHPGSIAGCLRTFLTSVG